MRIVNFPREKWAISQISEEEFYYVDIFPVENSAMEKSQSFFPGVKLIGGKATLWKKPTEWKAFFLTHAHLYTRK